MSSYRSRSSLRSHRKRWGLKQRELAELLALSRSAITKMERNDDPRSLHLLIAAELMFGVRAKDLYPGFYEQIEREVVKRARILDNRLSQEGQRRRVARLFLGLLMERARNSPDDSCPQLPLFG